MLAASIAFPAFNPATNLVLILLHSYPISMAPNLALTLIANPTGLDSPIIVAVGLSSFPRKCKLELVT